MGYEVYKRRLDGLKSKVVFWVKMWETDGKTEPGAGLGAEIAI